jgi:hypothetical protein
MSVGTFDLGRLNPTLYKHAQSDRVRGNIVVLTAGYLDFLRSPQSVYQQIPEDAEANAALERFLEIVDSESIVPLVQDDVRDEDHNKCASVTVLYRVHVLIMPDIESLLEPLHLFSPESRSD